MKNLLPIVICAALAATQVQAGGPAPAPGSNSNKQRDIVIGTVLIGGLIMWLTGQSQAAGAATTRDASPKPKVHNTNGVGLTWKF